MKVDTYTIIARVFPAILTSFPFFVLNYYFLKVELGDFWNNLLKAPIAYDITFGLVLLFLMVHICRLLSKELIENRFFVNGKHFPSVNLLLHCTSFYSSLYLKKIHARIKDQFGITIPGKAKESQDELESRKRIFDAFYLIRANVGGGKLVLQHNTEYGFIRNFLGGSIVAITVSVVNIVLFSIYKNPTALALSITSLVFYSIPVLMMKKVLMHYGESYAKVLIQEYMDK